MKRRRYMPHRRAYPPRLWPVVVVFASVAAILAYLIVPPLWLNIIVTAASAWTVVTIRWAIWRRRHPVISPEEVVEDMRRSARWN